MPILQQTAVRATRTLMAVAFLLSFPVLATEPAPTATPPPPTVDGVKGGASTSPAGLASKPEETAPKDLASQPQNPQPGQVWKSPKDGLDYVWIPPGTFQMGCSPGNGHFYYGCDGDEQPRHAVSISRGFWMGKTEVTVRAYKRFCSETKRPMPPAPTFNSGWGLEDHPIVNITWEDAAAFCRWNSGRLPTEAEWEYACRAGSDNRFYWGDTIDPAYCWYLENAGDQTHPVAQKSPNRWGLYDMLGNAGEWCADWYHERMYQYSVAKDPVGPGSGKVRVIRGGSWQSLPWGVRASLRGGLVPGESPVGRCNYCGLRSVIPAK